MPDGTSATVPEQLATPNLESIGSAAKSEGSWVPLGGPSKEAEKSAFDVRAINPVRIL